MDGCNERLESSELDGQTKAPSYVVVGSGFSQGLRVLARMIAQDLIAHRFPSPNGDKLTGKQDCPVVRNSKSHLEEAKRLTKDA